jgi:hypothetical protein
LALAEAWWFARRLFDGAGAGPHTRPSTRKNRVRAKSSFASRFNCLRSSRPPRPRFQKGRQIFGQSSSVTRGEIAKSYLRAALFDIGIRERRIFSSS